VRNKLQNTNVHKEKLRKILSVRT